MKFPVVCLFSVLFLSATAHGGQKGFFGFIPKASEVRPGVFKTSVTIAKARDIEFHGHFGWIPTTTIDRQGDENACASALTQAMSVGAEACADRYRRCRVRQVITQENASNCTKIVYVEARIAPQPSLIQPPPQEGEGASDAR